MKKWAHEIFIVIIGSILYGFGLNYFIVANNLAEGGLVGIALILHYNFPLSVGTATLLLNIPLVIIAYFIWGKEYVLKSLIGVICSWLGLELTSSFLLPVDNLLLAALYGGLIMGVGTGIILRIDGSTGGAAILARMTNQFIGLSHGRFYLFFDCLVLCFVGIIYGLEVALYSAVSVYVFSIVVDLIIIGVDANEQAMIISSKHEEIGQFISNELQGGFTYMSGRGGYSSEEKQVIMCIVSKWQIFKLKNYVKEIDREAFIVVTKVHEVLGRSFER